MGEISYGQIERAVAGAASELEKMRAREGEEIKKEILVHVCNVETMLEQVEQIFAQSDEIIRERLIKKACNFLKKASIELNKERLEQELFYYLERADIQEEISRIKSQIGQVKKESVSDVPVGRRMDFILQELNRETNTISSKSFCSEIQSTVVSMKVALEKIREQIQNVE